MTESERLHELYEYVSDLEKDARKETRESLAKWFELQYGDYAGYEDYGSFNEEYTRVWTEYRTADKYSRVLWDLSQKIWDMSQEAWNRENEWAKEIITE